MLAIFPELSEWSSRGDVNRLAVLTRQYFGGSGAAAIEVDVKNIAKGLGVNVQHMVLDHLGAIIVRDDKQGLSGAIFIPKGLESFQEKFLIAHLLGHFFLHIQGQVIEARWATGGFKEIQCPMRRYGGEDQSKMGMTLEDYQQEIEADSFAAALLLPKSMLQKAYAQLGSITKTAQFFHVPVSMIEHRLQEVGLVAQARVSIRPAVKQEKNPAVSAPRATPPAAAHPVAQKSGKGMERIRAIAKMLDKEPK